MIMCHAMPLPTQYSVHEQLYRYIVAQGPIEHTCGSFWQMVWEQNTQIILMLTSETVRRC